MLENWFLHSLPFTFIPAMSTFAQMSPRQLALSIPHIIDDIVNYLSTQDICNCNSVSREFHQVFEDYTWRWMSFRHPVSYSALCDKIRDTNGQVLAEKQHWIERISTIYGETWDLLLQRGGSLPVPSLDSASADAPIPQYTLRVPFTNLAELRASAPSLAFSPWNNNLVYAQQLLAAIEQLPRLYKLELIHVWDGDNTMLVQLAKIIRGHVSLKDLTFKMNDIVHSQYRQLMWACWNLL